MGRLRRFVESIRQPGEVWRWWPYSYQDKRYLVSNLGRVVYLRYYHGVLRPRLLNGCWSRGYNFVTIKVGPHKQRSFLRHRLVLETFKRKRKTGELGRHLDGNSRNNRLCNLKWGTPQQNSDDAVAHGVLAKAGANGNASTTNAIARKVFVDRRSLAECAQAYGLKIGTIRNIKKGVTYASATKGLVAVKIDGLQNIRGTNNHNAKLTEAHVKFIRQSEQSNAELGRQLGVHSSTVSRVRRGIYRKNG